MLPDSVLDGNPEDHFKEHIIPAADPDVLGNTMFDYFKKLAAMDLFIEKKGLEDELKVFTHDNNSAIEERTRDFVIESMAHIVASHER